MNKIINILDRILEVANDYKNKLDSLSDDFNSKPFILVDYLNYEDQLKNQVYAFRILNEYLKNHIDAIDSFKNKWSNEDRIDYLSRYDCHGLTNGKFYDYAVSHEQWRRARPDIYEFIEGKIEVFSILSSELKAEFKKMEL